MERSGEAQLHQHWLKTKTRFYMPVATRPDWQPIRSGVRQRNAGQAGTDLDEFDVNIANLQKNAAKHGPLGQRGNRTTLNPADSRRPRPNRIDSVPRCRNLTDAMLDCGDKF